jgi:KDO2-lipid IV(A) lauroyltransferase
MDRWTAIARTFLNYLPIALLRSLSGLPWSYIQTIGHILGLALVWIPNRQRRDALINIRLCFPELTNTEQLVLRRRAIQQFARTFVEMAALWLWQPKRVLALVKQETGTELLQPEPGCGLILLTPHLGAWELAGLCMAARGKITSMYRPLTFKPLDRLILAARQRNGGILVPDNVSGVKKLLRALKRGEMVGILPDQVTREETGSTFAPFFGVPAATMLLVAGLARRSQAKVVFVWVQRLSDNTGFHLHCLPAPIGIDSSDDAIAAAALNQGIQQCIEICPEQYQWTYRRFRRRPNQESSPYKGAYI